MKKCLFFFLLLIHTIKPNFAIASWQLSIHGKIMENNKPLKDVKVTVLLGGIEKEYVFTGNKGEFNVVLQPDGVYTLKFSKTGGYISKLLSVDTRNVPVTEQSVKSYQYPLDLSLFKEVKGFSTDILKDPIGKITYNPARKEFMEDASYTEKIQQRITSLLKDIEVAREKENLFNNYMVAADSLYRKKQANQALVILESALQLHVDDTLAESKIKVIREWMESEEKLRKEINHQKFLLLMEEGEVLFNDQSVELALKRYSLALKLNVDNKLAEEKINQCKLYLEKIENYKDSVARAASRKREFDRFISKGMAHLTAGYLAEAENCFKKAEEINIDTITIKGVMQELSDAYRIQDENKRRQKESEYREMAYREKEWQKREQYLTDLIAMFEKRGSYLAETTREKLEREKQKHLEKAEALQEAEKLRASLAKSYTQGITIEEIEGPNYLLTRYIKVEGTRVTEYKHIRYNFGSEYFHKNGKDIPEEVFRRETK